MYINTNILVSRGISLEEFTILQLAKQNKTENLTKALEKYSHIVSELLDRGLLTKVKPKRKKDPEMSLIRISKEGQKALDDIGTADIIEDDVVLYDWIKERYLERNKKIGNQKRSKIHLAQFRAESGIDKNCLAHLLMKFVNDDDNMAYSHILQNVFWKAEHAFQSKFNLDQSRLWQYYLNNRTYFDPKFRELKEQEAV